MRGRQLNLFGGDNRLANKRYSIVLPVDTLILLSVVMVLLLTLAFSLGIERGRKSARKAKETEGETLILSQEEASSELAAIIKGPPEEVELPPAAPSAEEQIEEQLKTIVAESEKEWGDKKYIIQVASYLKKEPAEAEAERLQENGYPAYLSQKGKFLVIFVGEFDDKQEAQDKMQSLRKRYKDCFMRKL